MITRDTIDKIQKLKGRRYSQEKISKELKISRSTVARYWEEEKELSGAKAVPKKFDLNDLFHVGKCTHCGLIYPMPKFMPAWLFPGCKKQANWKNCWYSEKA